MSAQLNEGALVIDQPPTLPAKAKRSRAVAVQQPATPPRLLQIALERGADTEQLEKLLALQERWEANEARKAYVAALSDFKSNPPRIEKNKHVNYTSKNGGKNTDYWHATLDNVVNAVSPALSRCGLAFQWFTFQGEAGTIGVRCVLRHVQGHSEEMSLTGRPDDSGGKNSIQGVGSTVTYLQRYTLLAILGLATEDQDDDAQGAGSAKVAYITDNDALALDAFIEENGIDRAKFMKWVATKGPKTLAEIKAIDHDAVLQMLHKAAAQLHPERYKKGAA